MKPYAAIALLIFASPLAAQNYPSRPIRMMVPAAAAGVTDIAARVLTPRLSEALGQSVVVDNRAGAGGIIGTDTVAKAAPDGHTLMTAFDSFVSNPYVFKKVPYDTLRTCVKIKYSIILRYGTNDACNTQAHYVKLNRNIDHSRV